MVKTSRDVRKKEAFDAFIKTLSDGTVAHWQTIAQAIGVDNDTITAWKRLPEAQEAIKRGIDTALGGMAKAGEKDWRMWECKLKMLGIGPIDKKVIELSATTMGKPLIPLLGGLTSNQKMISDMEGDNASG